MVNESHIVQTNTPLVSVCIPTYNDGLFIQESLESIITQSYQNIEIIIGDDSSTDNTSEIIQSFQDPRIRYYRNSRNLGQFENVNYLIQRAQGKYIAIYHSDDVYEREILEKEVNFLETNSEAGSVFALNWQINEAGQIIGKTTLLFEHPTQSCFSLTDVLPFFLRYKNRLLIGPSFMGRSEVFQQVGLFSSDYNITGDFEMWMRILSNFKIAVLNEPLMRYRRGKSQVSYDYNYLRTFEDYFFTIIDRYLTDETIVKKLDDISLIEYAFHRCDDETFRAANHVIKGDIAEAKTLLQKAYPLRTLMTAKLIKRKLRVLLLRQFIKICLAIGKIAFLKKFLKLVEYGEILQNSDYPGIQSVLNTTKI